MYGGVVQVKALKSSDVLARPLCVTDPSIPALIELLIRRVSGFVFVGGEKRIPPPLGWPRTLPLTVYVPLSPSIASEPLQPARMNVAKTFPVFGVIFTLSLCAF